MTSPTGTTTHISTHISTRAAARPSIRPVPEIVRTRNRLILLAEIGIGIAVLSAPLQLVLQDSGPWLWIFGGLLAGWSTLLLRRSVHSQDQRPEDELDEYELQRRFRARGQALRWSTISLLAIFVVGGVTVFTLKVMTNAGTDTESLYRNALSAFIYLAVTALYLVQFIELRDIARGMNRDLLLSENAEQTGDATDTTTATTAREDAP